MKVILRQTLPKVGKEGQVVLVADGFARNFLFPRGLATSATKPLQAELAKKQSRLSEELEKTKAGATGIAEKINGQVIKIVANTGKGSTKLFGAVTDEDIVAAVKSTLSIDIEKRMVALMHPIKRLGVYNILIALHPKVDATISLEVADENGWLGFDLDADADKEKVADEPVTEVAKIEEPAPEVIAVPVDTQSDTE